MPSQIDLQQLAVQRTIERSSSIRRRRPWFGRWGIPMTIIGGFVGLAGWSARQHWLPAKPVTVISVVLAKVEAQEAGTPIFQAAGWVEPRPTPVMCSALVEGVVEQMLVTEGQEVSTGDVMAKLVDADARLSVREAESTVELRTAERDAAKAALVAAQRNLDQPVQLEAAHAEAEAALAALETEIKNLPFLVRAAEARLELARQDLEGKKGVGNALAGRLLQKSQSEFETASASLEELEQREPNLDNQREAWQRKCDALHTRLELKTDENRALDEARADVAAAGAKLAQAKLSLEGAQLRLDRMVVRSPINGRVLALHAQPGGRVMGINAASERDASAIASLYDPHQLQVRADVRLEDVPQVTIGQPTQITSAATSEPLSGRVLAMTSKADIQKNTLQVKVAIENPSALIRPDMLVQVVFLSPERPNSNSEDQQPIRLLAPKELVETGSSTPTVLVADLRHEVARRRPVQLGRASTDQLVEVTQGLTPLDKLIVLGREGLADGARIRVTGQDQKLGATTLHVSNTLTPAPRAIPDN